MKGVKNRPTPWAFIAGTTALAAGFVVASSVLHLAIRPVVTPTTAQVPVTNTPPSPKVRLMAMGDMLAHDSIVAQAKTANDYRFTDYFTDIGRIYQDADLVFCNPETPVAGESLGISGYPSFNAPRQLARDLTATGCNVINLATNHIFDKGQLGIDQSRAVWQEQKPLLISGANRTPAEQTTVSYTTINDLKIAFLAFADFSNLSGYANHSINFYHDTVLVERLMQEARTNADVVIVSAHWGTEDSTIVNTDQREAAAVFARLGADVVIGTGPHVLQPVERIKTANRETLVWYSIGNMMSSQLEPNQLTSVIAGMTITKSSSRIIVSDVSAWPTYMSYTWSEQDRQAERLALRRDFKLRLLHNATPDITAMFANESYDSRLQYVTSTLGKEVVINKIRP